MNGGHYQCGWGQKLAEVGRLGAIALALLLLAAGPLLAGESRQGLTGRLELTLHDALYAGEQRRHDARLQEIHLTIEVVDGRWRPVAGQAPDYNIAAHEGAVVAGGMEGDKLEMRIEMTVRSDPWIRGGDARWDLALRREGDQFEGHWSGQYRGEEDRGKVTGHIEPLAMADAQVPRLHVPAHAAPRLEGDRAIRLVAPRRGAASGQVVIHADRPLPPVEATVGDLIRQQTAATCGSEVEGRNAHRIPAASIKVRYATMIQGAPSGRYYDALQPSSPDGAHTLPVWLTVEIDEHVEPGHYEGVVTLDPGAGEPVDVPVELTVARWTAPQPGDYTTHVGLMQSPESVAYHHGVEPWSDAHFERLEPSLKRLAAIGGDVLYLTAIPQTHLGNEHAMIPFSRDRDDALIPDLSHAQRYLDLYAAHGGRPNAVVLYVWEPDMHAHRGRPERIRITEVDDKGDASMAMIPMYDLEEETQRPWQRLIDAVHDHVDQLGWDREVVMLGTGSDWRPDARTLRTWRRIAPGTRWALFTHGRGDPPYRGGGNRPDRLMIGTMAVGLYELPWAEAPKRCNSDGPGLGGWAQPFLQVSTMRSTLPLYAHPMAYRNLPLHTTHGRYRGFGRIGFDYWPVDEGEGQRQGAILGRFRTYPIFDHNLTRDTPRYLTAPGEEGALATVRYEMLREGLQENEARIAIERALADPAKRRFLGADLRVQCQRVLDRQRRAFERGRSGSWSRYADAGWRRRAAELFETAAQVQRAIEP